MRLSLDGVTKSYGAQLVLDSVSLAVGPRSRIGLVGPNGVGKSTLLRILAGEEEPDAGTVVRAPSGLLVGYLAQERDVAAGEPLLRYLARRTGVAAAEAELDRLTALLAEDPDQVEPYTEALDRFLALGGGDLEARARAVCAELGLGARLDRPVTDLSGGEAGRAALAAILLARFDVFLLDEPTNDLDLAGLERLEGFLRDLAGGVVVISHDRAFLDATVTRVAEVRPGTHELRADLPRARFEISAAEREELVDRIGVAPLHARLRLRDARAPREEAEQRLTPAALRLLGQVADGADALDASRRRLVDAGEDAQQRRLAGAVRTDDADAHAGRNGERDAVENDRRAVLLRDVRRDNAAAAHARDLLIERTKSRCSI